MILTTDAVAVWRSGRTQTGRAKAERVQEADDAIAALGRGVDPVFVAQRDAERVRAWAVAQRQGRGEG